MPNITGEMYNTNTSAVSGYYSNRSGVFTSASVYSSGWTTPIVTNPASNGTIGFNASLSSSIYQNNAKVNPDNAEILYMIKY